MTTSQTAVHRHPRPALAAGAGSGNHVPDRRPRRHARRPAAACPGVGLAALRPRGHARPACAAARPWSRCSRRAVRAGRGVGVPVRRRRPEPGRGQHRPAGPDPGDPDQPGQADADATNAFLVGGLEPPAQREDYIDAIDLGRPADRRGRAAPAGRREGAGRAQRRRCSPTRPDRAGAGQQPPGLPVGAQYLKDASADLRADALPLLNEPGGRPTTSASPTEFDGVGTATSGSCCPGPARACCVLVLALFWLARRTRRYVNVPLAAAALVVLVTLCRRRRRLWPGRRHASTTVRDGVYAATLSTAAGPDRGVRRQVEREPHPDRPRLRCRLREGLDRRPTGGAAPSSPTRRRTRPPPTSTPALERLRESTSRSASSTTAATGTAPSRSRPGPARRRQRHLRSFDTSSDQQLSTLERARPPRQLDDAGGWLPLAAVARPAAGSWPRCRAWWGVALRLEEYR